MARRGAGPFQVTILGQARPPPVLPPPTIVYMTMNTYNQ